MYFIFRQQENRVDNQKCQAGFRPLCNKIPLLQGNTQKDTDLSDMFRSVALMYMRTTLQVSTFLL
jgi:hypothetical protein